jgi:hypothetical protein
MSIAEDIDILNSKVAQLKVEYEQYFMRVLRREPVKLRGEVDRLIRFYSTQSISNTSLKFKYNSVVAKYNSYKQYWTRALREIEEGTYVRRTEAVSSRTPPPMPQPPAKKRPEAEGGGGGGGGEGGGRAERVKSGEAGDGGGRDREGQGLKELYTKYIESRAKCNEPTKGISYESFTKTVEKTTKKAADIYKTKDVELKVSIKDGKTKLAIKPKKD